MAENDREFYEYSVIPPGKASAEKYIVSLKKSIYDSLADTLGLKKVDTTKGVDGVAIAASDKDSYLIALRVQYVGPKVAGKLTRYKNGKVFCAPSKVPNAIKNLTSKKYDGKDIRLVRTIKK